MKCKRLDLANSLRSDIKDNFLVFDKLNKSYNTGVIELSKEELILLTQFQSKTEFILNIKAKDRCHSLCEAIPKMSIKYFGVRLLMGDFRKITETYDQSLLEHLPIKERIKKATISAAGRDHSLQVAQSTYVQDTDDITISTDVKKTVHILHEGKTYSFNILNQILKL